MDTSVHEARWILAPVFGLCLAIISVGLFLS